MLARRQAPEPGDALVTTLYDGRPVVTWPHRDWKPSDQAKEHRRRVRMALSRGNMWRIPPC